MAEREPAYKVCLYPSPSRNPQRTSGGYTTPYRVDQQLVFRYPCLLLLVVGLILIKLASMNFKSKFLSLQPTLLNMLFNIVVA